MALENTHPVTLNVCIDCVQHIANGEGGCCHDLRVAGAYPYRRPEGAPCPTALRLERQHRDAVALVLGCADDDCEHGCRNEDGAEPWHSTFACDGCGVNLGGDREHATAFMPEDPRPLRTIKRHGWLVTIYPTRYNRSLYAVAWRGDDHRSLFSLPWGGAERWARVATFVASLPA